MAIGWVRLTPITIRYIDSFYELTLPRFMIGGLCVALPFGRLYGLLNTKWLYLSSVVLFMAGSALCGAAPNMSAMIVGRVLAGIGGNGMNTGVNTLYSMNTTEKERPLYMALVSVIQVSYPLNTFTDFYTVA